MYWKLFRAFYASIFLALKLTGIIGWIPFLLAQVGLLIIAFIFRITYGPRSLRGTFHRAFARAIATDKVPTDQPMYWYATEDNAIYSVYDVIIDYSELNPNYRMVAVTENDKILLLGNKLTARQLMRVSHV